MARAGRKRAKGSRASREPTAPEVRIGLVRREWRRMIRIAIILVLLVGGTPIALVYIYRDFAPPVTLLMLVRTLEGEGMKRDWMPLGRISRYMPQAVIALEDNTFCSHNGFDWAAIFDAAADRARGSRRVRGGSTITQQTSKNVFLWPSRTYVRKGLEVPFSWMIERVWGKRRIMEVYLNVIEWGPGVYGVEAASQHYFRKSARHLTRRQASLLAAILPNPRRWSARYPTTYIKRRANAGVYRIKNLGRLARCVR